MAISMRILVLAGLLLLGLAFTGPAKAQSFDCDRASTRVERLICGDEALKARDEGLADDYRLTLDVAADPDALVRSQRAWLRSRDGCPDARCVAQAYDDRSVALDNAERAEFATYRNARLGVSFEYMANRRVQPCPDIYDREQCVMIRGRFGGRPDEQLMTFQAFDGPLEQVAENEAGFEPRDGGWFTTYGRSQPKAVERFQGPGWTGMQATITCGISDETGFHAAGGECYWGVVSDGRRSILITTDGLAGLDGATRWSVETLRFLQP